MSTWFEPWVSENQKTAGLRIPLPILSGEIRTFPDLWNLLHSLEFLRLKGDYFALFSSLYFECLTYRQAQDVCLITNVEWLNCEYIKNPLCKLVEGGMSPGSGDELGSLISIPVSTVPSLQSPCDPSHPNMISWKARQNQIRTETSALEYGLQAGSVPS